MTGVTNRDSELIWHALALVVAANKTGAIDLDPQDRQDMERLLDASGLQDSEWELVPEEEILRRRLTRVSE